MATKKVENVEKKIAEVKADATKKVEAAKKTVEPAVKAAKEAAAPVVAKANEKIVAPAKKAAKKATETTKKVAADAKKTVTKKVAEKKETAKAEIILQFAGKDIKTDDILNAAKKAYAESNKAAIKSITLYVKPEDNAAYYVVNGDITGKVNL